MNSEILVSSKDGIGTLLNLLDETDFYVRYSSIELLRAILDNGKLLPVQDSILARTMGMDSLLGLLSDSREAIRNEALLLLVVLTQGNEEIQKIVAFNNIFERLAQLISELQLNDGGIVVVDCLK